MFPNDLIAILIIVFIITISGIVVVLTLSEFTAETAKVNIFQNTTAGNILNNANTSFSLTIDGVITLIFFGAIVLLVISVFYIKSHPVFFIFSVLLLIVAIIIAMVFSNTFLDVSESSSKVTD